jgi:hypothetical protein
VPFATLQSSLPIALYILGCAAIGIISTAMLTDSANKDIPWGTRRSKLFRRHAESSMIAGAQNPGIGD